MHIQYSYCTIILCLWLSIVDRFLMMVFPEKGKEILNDFSKYLPKFKKIIPHDYKKMLKKISEMEGKGLSAEQAQIEAFYEIKRG